MSKITFLIPLLIFTSRFVAYFSKLDEVKSMIETGEDKYE